MFFKGSRYQFVAESEWNDGRGRRVRYKKIRFIGDALADFAHEVVQGDRLDLLAHHYYRDPERFWRICDLNRGRWPDDLTAEPGRTLLIPPAEG